MQAPAVEVVHNAQAHRFEALLDGRLCRIDYALHNGTIRFLHTEVPAALQGRGIAAQLVRAALAYARAQGLAVEPLCSYVRAYMRRHPSE